MIYILMIWTVVGFAGTQFSTHEKYDWRPLGEFHQEITERKLSAKDMCEQAAKELGLKAETYRCVRAR